MSATLGSLVVDDLEGEGAGVERGMPTALE